MAAPVDPSDDSVDHLAPVDVVQVSGLIDEILIDEIEVAIRDAVANGSQALILQVNSPGAVVGRDRMTDLVETLRDAPIPIGVWVGPSGAKLTGLGMQMMAAADATAMAPGTHIGKMGAPLPVANVSFDFGAATERLRSESMGFQEARRAGALKLSITDEGVPAVRNMALALDGLTARGPSRSTPTAARRSTPPCCASPSSVWSTSCCTPSPARRWPICCSPSA
ncbi:MAG TPA: hypothetical protein PLV68_12270 [Ilumatobacteraceae bacterium]|nr:hypothetical protein [Ilumatobacteraceae bacterium]